jgi:hypothetical protein
MIRWVTDEIVGYPLVRRSINSITPLLLAALCSRSMMSFAFQRCDNVVEALDVGACYVPRDIALEIRQMTVDAAGELSTVCRKSDKKRAAISRADLARDQAAVGEAVKDAGQGGSLVCKTAVEIGHLCRRGLRE